MSKNLKIKIGVDIDQAKARIQLENTLKSLQKNKVKIAFDVDTKSLNALKKTLDSFKNIKINVGTTGGSTKSMAASVKETNTALNQQKALYSQLKQLQNEEYQIKKRSVGQDGEYKKVLEQQLKVVKEKQTAIQKQISTSEKGLSGEQKALKLAEDRLKKERELQQAKAKTNTEMDRAIKNASKNMNTTGLNTKEIESFRRQLESINKVNMKQVREEINSVNKAMNEQRLTATDVGNSLRDVGDSLIGVGQTILEVFALPVAGIAYATKEMMSFTAEMSKVEAISASTSGEMAQLEGMAKDLGRTTVWSATEAGEALRYMGGYKSSCPVI